MPRRGQHQPGSQRDRHGVRQYPVLLLPAAASTKQTPLRGLAAGHVLLLHVAEAVGADQPFNDDSIIEALPERDAIELDKSFIDDLDDSLAEEVDRDRLNG